MTKTTPLQFFLALVGGLFAPLIAIILIVLYVVHIETHYADEVGAGQGMIAPTPMTQGDKVGG